MKQKSKKDINDKFLMSLGFFRCPEYDNSAANANGDISFWINDIGIRLITNKKTKADPKNIVKQIAEYAAYRTKQLLQNAIMLVDHRFTPEDH